MKEYPSKFRAPERRFDRGNRQFENPQYISQDRQNPNQRKKFINRKNDPLELLNDLLKKAAPELKDRLDEISHSQKRLADAEERKAAALERIATCFQGGAPVDATSIKSSSAPVFETSPASEPVAETSPASEPVAEITHESKPAPEPETLPKKQASTPDQAAEKPLPPLDAPPVSPIRAKATDEDRTRALQIIKKMYQKEATYNQIALRLEEENLPTFSGRGKWHAQTIHRLLKK